jgi:putative ABC transport system substrate-binding protein
LAEFSRSIGYIDGQTVRFEFLSDRGQPGRLSESARELVHLKVVAIVQAARDILIVMAFAEGPVATGMVESLSRPGNNVTGISGDAAELAGKNIKFIGSFCRRRAVSALVNETDPRTSSTRR